jgi:hypothetical protein
MKEDEMGGACSTCDVDKLVEKFGWRTLRQDTIWET